jgi:hypothetical protein
LIQELSPFHVARVWPPRKRDSAAVKRFAPRCRDH